MTSIHRQEQQAQSQPFKNKAEKPQADKIPRQSGLEYGQTEQADQNTFAPDIQSVPAGIARITGEKHHRHLAWAMGGKGFVKNPVKGSWQQTLLFAQDVYQLI